MAPIDLKLGQNVFQSMTNVSFVDAEKLEVLKFVANFDRPFTPGGWLRLT